MFCKNCGNQIFDGEKFCRNCGTPVEKTASAVSPQTVENTEQPKVIPVPQKTEEKISLDKNSNDEKDSLEKESKTEEKNVSESNNAAETPQTVDTAVPSTPKFCKGCGHPLTEGVKFCKNCGKPVESNMSINAADAPISAPTISTTPKFCKGCGKQLAEGVKFCKNCGKPVESNMSINATNAPTSAPTVSATPKFCKGCGKQLAAGVKFCKNCGKPVTENDTANEPTTVIPPMNVQPSVNQSTIPTEQPAPYNTVPPQPRPPKKPLPKGALIGIIAGGVALIVIVIVLIVLISIGNDPVNKMMGYIDSGSTSDAKQLYASSFRYNEENLSRLEAEVIKKVEEIEKQYVEGTLTEEQAMDKLDVICALSSYNISEHGYEGKQYIENINDAEEYFEKATQYKDKGEYLNAARYYSYVAKDTPKYQDAQNAIKECLNSFVQEAFKKADEYVKDKNYKDAIDALNNAIYNLDSDKYADYIKQLNDKIDSYNKERQKAFENAMNEKVKSEGYLKAIEDLDDVAYDMGISLETNTYNEMVEGYKNAYINEALGEAKKLADNGDYSAAATVLKRANEAYNDIFWGDLDDLISQMNEYAKRVFSLNDLEDLATKSSGWNIPRRNDSGVANYAFTGLDGQDQYMYTVFSATYWETDTAIKLDKKYTNFKGIASLSEDYAADKVTMTFVGDGKKLKTIVLDKDHATEDFDIDFTGISTLNITVKKVSNDNFANADIALVNNVVTKVEESKPEESKPEESKPEESKPEESSSETSNEVSQASH